MSTFGFQYRVGFLGCPADPQVPWNADNVGKLQSLGFNAIQLNIAWGSRPADEPLNLEDVVEIPAGRLGEFSQPVPLRGAEGAEKLRARRAALTERIRLCRAAGVRAIFHFGAPYNAHCRYGDSPPNCIMHGQTADRYVALLELFAAQFPGVDDLLLYTYDQDAWLCSEFDTCPRCAGVPLHLRVAPFVNRLAQAWHRLQPAGRLWWEPWELSAGQVFKSIGGLDAQCVGLALHSNIAEVMATNPVDRWLKLTCRMAKAAGIPVIVEHFLGGPTEELEPFLHLAYPQALLRSLRAIADLAPDGIKEYYGLVPTREDPNLRLTGLFLADSQISEQDAMSRLAAPYGRAAGKIIEFWRLASEAMELFPWNASWYIREVGRCNPDHSTAAAFIRGQQAHTPSWESTRRAVFMKTDNAQPDPWMLEDVQLQCAMAIERMTQALEIGNTVQGDLSAELAYSFAATLIDLHGLRRRAASYVYHLRETNLATVMRQYRSRGEPIPSRVLEELTGLLRADVANQDQPGPCAAALDLLAKDVDRFLATCFLVPLAEPGGGCSIGEFSVTSR